MTDRRVLILEPDDELAIMVEQFLRASEFAVARARDPDQAKWMAPLIKPHLVLVDFWPSDGVDIAMRLRDGGAIAETSLVMIIPENLENENPQLAGSLKEVYDGFLFKPFADTELLRVVENFTGFGSATEDEVGGALDQLMDSQMASPELRNVVRDLRERQAKQNNDHEKQTQKKIEELEAELEAAKEASKQQSGKISDLLSKISDLEIDHSFALESSEEEKRNIEKEIDKLSNRIKELEEAQAQASKAINKAHKILQNKS